MPSIRQSIGNVLLFGCGITMLICLGAFLYCFLGLFLKLFELIFGEKDYSKWMMMSAAEEPLTDLLLIMGGSAIIFFACIMIGVFAEEKLLNRQPGRKKKLKL